MIERKESLLEKKLNFITHGIGLVLSVIGLFYLVEKSILYPKSFNLISSLVYGISLIVMYSSSTIYHYYIDSKYSRVLQKNRSYQYLFANSRVLYTRFTS